MSRRLPSILTTSEIEALLVAARAAADAACRPARQQTTWRDFVMVKTGLLAGPRVAELCALEVTDIDLTGAVLAIRHGKGDKDRNVPIAAKLLVVLREWIGTRTAGWLFPGPNGKQLCTRTFQRRLETLATAAGIVKTTHPHMLRHSFATSLLKRRVNLRVIQTLLRHSSVAVTEIYTHIDTTDMKVAVDRL